MAKPPGKCIFCGGGGLTKAHIFPEWLHLLNHEKTQHHLTEVGVFHTFTPQIRSPALRRTVHQGDSGTRKVRKVCKGCNSGWLGSLETPAKPSVLRLMSETRGLIDQPMQIALARWLCAIVMLVDASEAALSAVPQSDRDHFRQTTNPPRSWRIWIARYADGNWHAHRARHVGLNVLRRGDHLGMGEPDCCNTQVTTLVLRQLCAHVYSSTVLELPGYEGVALQQLWPPTDDSFLWELAPRLNDAGIIALSEALARDLQPF